MNKCYEAQKINISLLDLDTQNPRFLMLYNDSHSQDDIINYLLKNENALEIVKSIYENKDFFEDSFCYVLEQNGRYIVKEGNRRIAALKALAEPSKYLTDLKFERFFVDSVNCLIYNDVKALNEKIFNRHTQIEVKSWSRLAQGAAIQEYLNKGGKLSDLKYIKDYKNVYRLFKLWEATNQIDSEHSNKFKSLLIEGKRAAIIERFFGREDLLIKMGFSFNKNLSIDISNMNVFTNSIDAFIKWLNPLNTITAHHINKNTIQGYFDEVFSQNGYVSPQTNLFDSVEINKSPVKTEEDNIMEKSLENDKSFKDDELKNSNKINDNYTERNSSGVRIKENKSLLDRTTLFPTNFKLKIPKSRTNDIYLEMKDLSDNNQKESFAIMTRIFLEFTVDDYGDKNIPIYKDKRENSNNFKLRARIICVAENMHSNDLLSDKELNAIKTTIDNEKSPVKIEALNQYVHNSKFSPDESSLKVFWDNIRPLFERIWC